MKKGTLPSFNWRINGLKQQTKDMKTDLLVVISLLFIALANLTGREMLTLTLPEVRKFDGDLASVNNSGWVAEDKLVIMRSLLYVKYSDVLITSEEAVEPGCVSWSSWWKPGRSSQEKNSKEKIQDTGLPKGVDAINARNHYKTNLITKRMSSFTFNEKEVLGLISLGLTTKEIAGKLNISFHTVETHRKNLLRKCEAKNSAQLVQMALSQQLMTL
jgi:DNA-binding CsgD family transcriptional regulator